MFIKALGGISDCHDTIRQNSYQIGHLGPLEAFVNQKLGGISDRYDAEITLKLRLMCFYGVGPVFVFGDLAE